MAKLFANSGDPDQMPHSAPSDLGLHCLPITLLEVSRLQWVNEMLKCMKHEAILELSQYNHNSLIFTAYWVFL